MSNDSSYLKRNPQAIVKYLNLLIEHNCLVTINFGEGQTAFVTGLLLVDSKNNKLLFDKGADAGLNKQLLRAGSALFTSNYGGISVEFSSQKIQETSFKGQMVFAMALPESICWQERREFYRLRIPLSVSAYCEIALANQSKLQFKMYDISIAGFSMLIEPDDQEAIDLLVLDKQFTQCQLRLSASENITIDFLVCDIIQPGNKKLPHYKIGCKFTKISMLSESAIQRYMQKTQLESERKTRG